MTFNNNIDGSDQPPYNQKKMPLSSDHYLQRTY